MFEKFRNKQILKICERIDNLCIERDLLIKKIQVDCKHEHVVECDYMKFASGGSSLGPLLKCLNCGREADGWHWDKEGLDKNLRYKIEREDLYKLRYR